MTPFLNKKPIAVDQDFSVRMSWINPACFFDKIPGNAGLGIEIPVNEYTRAVFGNPERFEKYSQASDRKFPGFELRAKGVLIEAGTLVITDANSERYSGWLQSELGVMGEAQRDKFIPDLDWKEDVELEYKSSFDPETDEFCLVKIKNEHFWQGKGAHGNIIIEFENDDQETDEREEYVNYLEDSFMNVNDSTINEVPADYIESLPPGQHDPNIGQVVSPYMFFTYLVKEALRLNRFYIREHPFEQIHAAKYLAVYNNYNIFDITPITVDRSFTTFNRRRNLYESVVREVIESTRSEERRVG